MIEASLLPGAKRLILANPSFNMGNLGNRA